MPPKKASHLAPVPPPAPVNAPEPVDANTTTLDPAKDRKPADALETVKAELAEAEKANDGARQQFERATQFKDQAQAQWIAAEASRNSLKALVEKLEALPVAPLDAVP